MKNFKLKRPKKKKSSPGLRYSYSDRRDRKMNNLYDYDPKFFHKIKPDPPIFIAEIDQNDYEHLLNDDLDEISKLEVSYKILKN